MPSIFFSGKSLSALPLQVSGVDGRSQTIEVSAANVLRSLRQSIARIIARSRSDRLDAAVDDRADLNTLRVALFDLPVLAREALLQQVQFGHSITEIAVHLQLPEADVRTLLIRARRQMRLLCGEDTRLDPHRDRP